MRIQVTRQACCAADDQVGPLNATYVCEASAPMSKLIQEIVASGFLQPRLPIVLVILSMPET